MITPKDIEKKTMSAAKRAEAKNSFFAFYIGRPLSYVLTIPLLYTSIAPNTVTIVSILFLVAGYILFTVGHTTGKFLLGLLMIFLWNMGDGIDGNIARYKDIKSENGDLLDTLGGYLAMSMILLGMGNVAFNDPLGNVYVCAHLPIVLSGISAVSTLVPRVLMHRKLAKNAQSQNAEALKDKEHYGLARIIALNICDPAGLQEVIMLIAILFHLATEFTIVYCILNIAIMSYSIKNMME